MLLQDPDMSRNVGLPVKPLDPKTNVNNLADAPSAHYTPKYPIDPLLPNGLADQQPANSTQKAGFKLSKPVMIGIAVVILLVLVMMLK